MTAMTTPRLTLTTAAVAAVTALACASTAVAAEAQKPAQTAAPRAVAPDAAAAARASEIAKTTSALGSYYDSDSGEQVVVTGRKSRLTEAAVDKAVGAPARLERLTITGATVDAIKDELAARDFSPSAKKYSYGGYLDLESGKYVLTTDAPAAVTDQLTEDHPAIDLRRDTVRDMFHRLDDAPSFWGGASIMSPGVGTCSNGFAVQRGGQRFMTTAGHCFGVGQGVFTPPGRFVGTVVQRGQLGSPFPWDNRDTELIGGSSYCRARLRRRDLQHDLEGRGQRRRPGPRLHRVLHQRSDVRRAVRHHGPEHRGDRVHGDRVQVAGDLIHGRPFAARRLGRADVPAERSVGVRPRHRDRG